MRAGGTRTRRPVVTPPLPREWHRPVGIPEPWKPETYGWGPREKNRAKEEKVRNGSDVMVHVFNLATQEAKAGLVYIVSFITARAT